MDLLIRSESKGIHYEGYENEFIQCIFEESDVEGRNERYEFRCRPDLECCGRLCCIPQDAIIPLWLLILFIILSLLLLCALLGSIAWFCGKRRTKPKHIQPRREKLPIIQKQVEVKKTERFMPSPMKEELIQKPEPHKVVAHREEEISIATLPETVDTMPVEPQRAQLAYYRQFIPDPVDEVTIPQPERQAIFYHDISKLIGKSRQPSSSKVEQPQSKRAELMYCRPGFDNVPSY